MTREIKENFKKGRIPFSVHRINSIILKFSFIENFKFSQSDSETDRSLFLCEIRLNLLDRQILRIDTTFVSTGQIINIRSKC